MSLCKILIYFVPNVPPDLRADIIHSFLKGHQEVVEKLLSDSCSHLACHVVALVLET